MIWKKILCCENINELLAIIIHFDCFKLIYWDAEFSFVIFQTKRCSLWYYKRVQKSVIDEKESDAYWRFFSDRSATK